MSKPIAVLHIVDTLEAAGRERVAVNLVNHLPREQYKVLLWSTRKNGPLIQEVASDVMMVPLKRTHRFDLRPFKGLIAFIRKYDIQILHAHGDSVFVAILAAFCSPFPAVLWHAHTGGWATKERAPWPYRLLANRINGVIAVTQALADWACLSLRVPSDKVWYIPNFVWKEAIGPFNQIPVLPGQKGERIVCLANLRPVKDHVTLLHAMAIVHQRIPNAHLILIGSTSDSAYLARIQRMISNYQLNRNITLLGHQDNVISILHSCDIGVLNSISEGFPMTILEYGTAGLPTVATNVGQCPEILDEGRAGILVPPGSPTQLAEALGELLQSPVRRDYLGKQLNRHVHQKYSPHNVLKKICLCYESVLDEKKDAIPFTL